ncbi:MAG: Transcriptional repressor SmtB [Chroococcidiopsis sp. SAG 2025]|nr:metalloregulator ArsR/SmtB family transcription factor [Chroococcidiopsis sp. SAG 2025]MDV2994474.1 Transcriptional repressor SmtB [Chroococcidiopsis sp. SAG 2025]
MWLCKIEIVDLLNCRSSMPEISLAALAQVAEYFKVLSEISRLQVLNCLRSGAKNVTEIVAATGLGQANVSKHLKVLMQAGMVRREPRGISVFYEIADPIIFDLCEVVCDRISNRLLTQARQLEQFKSGEVKNYRSQS